MAQAERVAREALLRSWSRWPAEHRSGDVDVLVYGELLAARATGGNGSDDSDSDVARVLTRGARLGPHQVEDLTGTTVDTAASWGPEEWASRYAAPAPLAEIRRVLRARRRRRTLATLAAAAVVALVGFVLVVSGEDTPAPEPDPPQSPNAIPLAWWSDDVLHLGGVEVDVPGLEVLAQAGTDPSYAVVYGDSLGQVVQVEADGGSAAIGVSEPGEAVLGSARGRVAWIDRTGGTPDLVLWDADTRAAVASLDLTSSHAGADAVLVGFDGEAAYLRTSDGLTDVWLGAGDSTPVDSRSPYATVALGGRDLSPDARLLAEWTPGGSSLVVRPVSDPGRPRPMEVPGTRVLTARFVDDVRLVVVATRTYLLGRDFDDGITQSGRFPVADLVTCDVTTGACATAQRRVQDVDPSADRSGIVLAEQ
ncbi:hypothetical protein [Nocardioides sp.]|uniref:hypothetical protein n=1 Tax=Nocardioides sp. TaxID=35761 RepID=UPI00321A3276